MKFKVGDRVKLISYSGNYYTELKSRIGLTGTIKYVYDSDIEDYDYVVEFDENFGGHNGGGHCKDGHGQNIYEKDLELISSKSKRIPVGSKVKIGKDYLHGSQYAGRVGILEDDDQTSLPYKVKFEDGDERWFEKGDVELYTEPAVEPPTPTKPKIPTGEDLILSSRTLDKFKYIARDQNGWLFACTERPIKDIGGTQWYSSSYYIELPKELFKFITWEQSPIEIKNLKGGYQK